MSENDFEKVHDEISSPRSPAESETKSPDLTSLTSSQPKLSLTSSPTLKLTEKIKKIKEIKTNNKTLCIIILRDDNTILSRETLDLDTDSTDNNELVYKNDSIILTLIGFTDINNYIVIRLQHVIRLQQVTTSNTLSNTNEYYGIWNFNTTQLMLENFSSLFLKNIIELTNVNSTNTKLKIILFSNCEKISQTIKNLSELNDVVLKTTPLHNSLQDETVHTKYHEMTLQELSEKINEIIRSLYRFLSRGANINQTNIENANKNIKQLIQYYELLIHQPKPNTPPKLIMDIINALKEFSLNSERPTGGNKKSKKSKKKYTYKYMAKRGKKSRRSRRQKGGVFGASQWAPSLVGNNISQQEKHVQPPGNILYANQSILGKAQEFQGGNLGSVLTQGAAPASLFAANYMMRKPRKTKRKHSKKHKRKSVRFY